MMSDSVTTVGYLVGAGLFILRLGGLRTPAMAA